MTERKTLSLPKRPTPTTARTPPAQTAAPAKPAPTDKERTPRPPTTGRKPRQENATPSRAAKPRSQGGKSTSDPRSPRQVRRTAAPLPPQTSGERLAKRVMQLKDCSRSEAEQYITSGFVRVDGVLTEDPPLRVPDAAVVTVSPDATLLAPSAVSFVVHKPPQWLDGLEEDDAPASRRGKAPPSARTLLVPGKQWGQGPAQQAFLKRHTQHLEASVPLESGASGLVVFTQDWRITRKLEEHLGEMEHEYMVDIAQPVSAEQLQAVTHLLKDPRERLPSTKASISASTPSSTRLRFAVKGAHPGLIAYVLGKVGLPIAALQRTRLGRIALGQLPVGQWRYLAPFEKF